MRDSLIGFRSAYLKDNSEILFVPRHIASFWTASSGYTAIQIVGTPATDAAEVLESLEEVEKKILDVMAEQS